PWHASLVKEIDLSALPMNPAPDEIELHFQREKFAREVRARNEVTTILASSDMASLRAKVIEVVDSISQTSKNDLIHYVSMRKCVLDLFRKALEIDEAGKYRSEGDVHDVIVPRRRDSDNLNYEQHNLWILDERLNFASYIASDKPLQGHRSN